MHCCLTALSLYFFPVSNSFIVKVFEQIVPPASCMSQGKFVGAPPTDHVCKNSKPSLLLTPSLSSASFSLPLSAALKGKRGRKEVLLTCACRQPSSHFPSFSRRRSKKTFKKIHSGLLFSPSLPSPCHATQQRRKKEEEAWGRSSPATKFPLLPFRTYSTITEDGRTGVSFPFSLPLPT